MTLQEFLQQIAALEAHAASLVAGASSAAELESARNQLVGRKSGALSALIRELPSLSADDRRPAGAAANRAKAFIDQALETRASELAASAPSAAKRDLTMPARRSWKGGKHPVTLVIEEQPQGFHLDEQSQQELLEAMREIDRGDFVTEEELFAELAQLK